MHFEPLAQALGGRSKLRSPECACAKVQATGHFPSEWAGPTFRGKQKTKGHPTVNLNQSQPFSYLQPSSPLVVSRLQPSSTIVNHPPSLNYQQPIRSSTNQQSQTWLPIESRFLRRLAHSRSRSQRSPSLGRMANTTPFSSLVGRVSRSSSFSFVRSAPLPQDHPDFEILNSDHEYPTQFDKTLGDLGRFENMVSCLGPLLYLHISLTH